MEATQGTSMDTALTVTLLLKETAFEPVDLGEHHICRLLYTVYFDDKPGLNVFFIVLKNSFGVAGFITV